MGFQHLRNRVASTPPTAAPQTPVTASAPAAEAQVIVPEPVSNNPLTTFAAGLPTISTRGIARTRSLLAFGSGYGLFPRVLLGGKSGMFEPDQNIPAELKQFAPSGMNPIPCGFLGYRLNIVSWPVGYEDTKEDTKPVWSAALPADSNAWDDAIRACRVQQYTAKAGKAKFDFDTSKVGHLAPSLELLVFIAGLGLAVVTTPGKITSVQSTLETLEPFIPTDDSGNPTGELQSFAATLTPKTIAKQSATWKWSEHHIVIGALPGKHPDVAKLGQAYSQWQATAPENTSELFEKWNTGADAPLTDVAREAIARGVAL